MDFREFYFRDCPKSLGDGCNAALGGTETVLFGSSWPSYTLQSTLGALPVPLFGQSQRKNSPKFDHCVPVPTICAEDLPSL